jgi:cephalosporin-C deacetylase-like acetyl esterase
MQAAAVDRAELDFLTGRTDFGHIREMLPDDMRRRAIELLDARARQAAQWQASDVTKRRAYMREQTWKSLGGMPERTPLNARVTGTLERRLYRIEKVIFESQPGFFVTANLYIPKTGKAPYPAVLYPLGHEEGAKAHETWQQMLGTLASRGYVALAWDTFGQGERIQFWDDDFKGSKAQQSTLEHTLLGTSTLVSGDALARYTIWDGMRALDYLLSRPEVDAKHVAVTGNSGGGTHTAYLSALDDRLTAAASSCYITSWRRILETIGPQDAEQCFPGWLGAGLDHGDFIASFAPKPYLILSAIRDFFSITGARETYAEAQRNFRLLGVPDHIAMVEADDGHGYSAPRRKAAYAWFDRWLKGVEPSQEPEPVIEIATEEELWCTKTGQVLTALGGETVHSLNRKRAARFHPGAVTKEVVARRIGYQPVSAPLNTRSFGVLDGDGFKIEKVLYQSEPGTLIPALLYLPAGAGAKPAVLLAAGEGKAASSREAESLAKAGLVVLSIDARGFGETRSAGDPNDRPWTRYFGDYNSAMTAILTGRTLLGFRTLDITRGVDLLAGRPEVNANKIYALGRGAAATAVLHAAVLDGRIRGTALENMLVSYQSVADYKIHLQVFEQVIPGVLQDYDLAALARSLAPRKVWIVDARDPLGQTVSLEEVNQQYQSAAIRVMRRHIGDSSANLYHFED